MIYKTSRGERGIRTPETLLTFTRFPGVPLQPREHLSKGKNMVGWSGHPPKATEKIQGPTESSGSLNEHVPF